MKKKKALSFALMLVLTVFTACSYDPDGGPTIGIDDIMTVEVPDGFTSSDEFEEDNGVVSEREYRTETNSELDLTIWNDEDLYEDFLKEGDLTWEVKYGDNVFYKDPEDKDFEDTEIDVYIGSKGKPGIVRCVFTTDREKFAKKDLKLFDEFLANITLK